MKPLIAIASNKGEFNGWENVNVNVAVTAALEQSGGVPLVVPMTSNKKSIEQLLSVSSGLFLPGGSDVQPLSYGELPHPMLCAVQPDLDEFQTEIINMAINMEMPILGVCRGIQILNVALGGTLIQHIPTEKPFIQHLASTHKKWDVHWINSVKGSLLEKLFGKRFLSNSYHHQAPDKIADDLVATGIADDGIVEVLEHKTLDFVVAVQWHPECMLMNDNRMLPLFQEFISAASNYKQK